MTNLWEILKVSKGLPSPDLKTILFARKIGSYADVIDFKSKTAE